MSTSRRPKPPPSLFHPKKKPAPPPVSSSPKRSPVPNGAPNGAAKRPSSTSQSKVEDGDLVIPDGPFHEYRLLSSSLSGWKYDVMKLDSRKPVDVMRWHRPVRLNRKDIRRAQESQMNTSLGELKPMLGADGKEVFGPDGKRVMVTADGRLPGQTPPSASSSSQQKGNVGKKKFQKKTKQVFVVPEETRKLRREERYPWVLQDGLEDGETWIGQLEDISRSSTHAIFMPAENDVFKFVPTHRWYKFQKKLKHDLPTDTASVESAYTKSQKNDPQAWLKQRVGPRGISSATIATLEGRENNTGSLVYTSSVSLGPGGRGLRTVDSGMNLFGEDDDEDNKDALRRKREKEYGGEGDFDEMVYEEDFADDEEMAEADADDEEAKELEERIKREYIAANKQREGYIDETDDEDDNAKKKSKQERRMEKIIRNREGNDAYESDEDENPYASEQESSDDEEIPQVPPAAPAPEPPEPNNSNEGVHSTPKPQQNDGEGSRATSPVPSTGLGGHSVVAKRATSPKAPKLKTNNLSRAGSPLANGSPTGSRAGSPTATNGAAQKKRKATEDPGSPASPGGAPKPKKRKPTAPVGGELDDKMVIDWLKRTPNAKTRDCIQYFTPYLTDEGKKQKFTQLVKEVAHLKNGVLTLKSAYQGETPQPAGTA